LEFGYHPEARKRFEQAAGVDPLWLEGDQSRLLRESRGEEALLQAREAWAQWRRDQVTAVVRRIHAWMEEHRPGIVLSAAVFADADIAVDRVLQDWPAWLEEGIVDLVVPMAYTPDEKIVAGQVRKAVMFSGG